ncbi:pentatricopeptide repeat protein [Aspergillus piperis CBS 112811]|uniref:Pentatricopeptide repeat protein n=1 Tax=Aspergillus piperis CBS 112811 TaxID=1448313 RepID=A0A8G1R8D8_9EURO|nr:pentatricopeptide repeat protein [Aspergillus piperis CBS 112811]RAH59745.1 pentatricopeptide repeat protein [Aspergillus piperis CBS 112811]
MLRCGNATALRSGSVAMKPLLRTQWLRTTPSRSIFHIAESGPRIGTPGRQFARIGSLQARQMHGAVAAEGSPASSSQEETAPREKEEREARETKPAHSHGKRKSLEPSSTTDENEVLDKRTLLRRLVRREWVPQRYLVPRTVLNAELKWLRDPHALAERVRRCLADGHLALGLKLIQMAHQKRFKAIPAFNRLLEYLMREKEPELAFRAWNDMKKRGMELNSRSYTIFLNGLCQHFDIRGFKPVKLASKVYMSLYAEGSHVEPHIIHANAMLKVCWWHRDMEVLWEVAGALPESGKLAPDLMTYTTLLGAVAGSTRTATSELYKGNIKTAERKQVEVEPLLQRRAQGIQEAKRVWADIIYQWKKGQVPMDNYLAHAMAHMLQENSSCDHDVWCVFALYNQTAGIPIFAEEPPKERIESTSEQKRVSSPHSDAGLEDDIPFVDEGDRLHDTEPEETEDVEAEENFDHLFDPVVGTVKPPVKTRLSMWDEATLPRYIEVGNRELTMLLKACLSITQGTAAAKEYWRYLTQGDEPKVVPDAVSYHAYLRILRAARASRESVEVVRNMTRDPTGPTEGKTFRISMASCTRDRRNPNVFRHANELLDLMANGTALPDARSITQYLDLVHSLEDSPDLLMSLAGLESGADARSNNLSALGVKLKASLITSAAERLCPLIRDLDEAVSSELLGEKSRQSYLARIAKTNPSAAIRGEDALKALTMTRRLFDSVKEIKQHVPPETFKEVQRHAELLKKYSDKSIIPKFRNTLVGATAEQMNRLAEREVPSA